MNATYLSEISKMKHPLRKAATLIIEAQAHAQRAMMMYTAETLMKMARDLDREANSIETIIDIEVDAERRQSGAAQ